MERSGCEWIFATLSFVNLSYFFPPEFVTFARLWVDICRAWYQVEYVRFGHLLNQPRRKLSVNEKSVVFNIRTLEQRAFDTRKFHALWYRTKYLVYNIDIIEIIMEIFRLQHLYLYIKVLYLNISIYGTFM